MLQLEFRACQIAASVQLTDATFNLSQFLINPSQTQFYAQIQQWSIAPDVSFDNPARLQAVSKSILQLLDKGFDAERNEFFSIHHWNFKQKAKLQFDLQWLGLQIEGLYVDKLSFATVRREALVLVEYFCGRNWRSNYIRAFKPQRVVTSQSAALAA